MGKRYHCEYCNRSFADTPHTRKKHINGVQHKRNRKLHYDSFKGRYTQLKVFLTKYSIYKLLLYVFQEISQPTSNRRGVWKRAREFIGGPRFWNLEAWKWYLQHSPWDISLCLKNQPGWSVEWKVLLTLWNLENFGKNSYLRNFGHFWRVQGLNWLNPSDLDVIMERFCRTWA